MISIIKTAIITIVISFISGLLLDYYKNLAPRILCNIGKGIPIKINNKKICAYIITIRNISNKIIHEVTLNIQSPPNNLKIEDAKITKGLKFDSLIKDNIFDVNIPFLSKGDEFSVTVCVENQYGEHKRPVIIIRSPENFKEVDSIGKNGVLSLLFNIPKNTNKVVSKTKKENREIVHRNKKPSKNKKARIIAVSAIIVIIIGVLAGFYFNNMPSSTQTPNAKTDVQKQSTDGTTKNADAKTSTGGTTGNTNTKTATGEATGTTDTKTSTGETTGNTDTNTKTATSETTGNTDTKATTSETTGSTDAKTATGETAGSTDTKTSTGEKTGSTDTKTATGETTGTTDANAATGETTGTTDAKTATGGITGTTGTTGN